MDGGHSFPFSQESILRVERCSTMLGADVMALQQSRSEIQNPLPCHRRGVFRYALVSFSISSLNASSISGARPGAPRRSLI